MRLVVVEAEGDRWVVGNGCRSLRAFLLGDRRGVAVLIVARTNREHISVGRYQLVAATL
jgi:hypothetical protein